MRGCFGGKFYSIRFYSILQVARHLLRTRLPLELLGTLPVGYWAAGLSWPHLLRLLLLPKLQSHLAALLSAPAVQFMHAAHVIGVRLRLVQLTIVATLVLHTYACAWWLSHRVASVGHVVGGASPTSWVVLDGLVDSPPLEQYFYAVYKAASIITCFGYGSHLPAGIAGAQHPTSTHPTGTHRCQ